MLAGKTLVNVDKKNITGIGQKKFSWCQLKKHNRSTSAKK